MNAFLWDHFQQIQADVQEAAALIAWLCCRASGSNKLPNQVHVFDPAA